ncbi:helix-turn-helix transcriptional regulator [Actinomadura miaoliensis]|uniref:Helix-turn-helix transcriptional regulator n=1 Tax=Actinomadura miaoliensis TaxID=430685 RepID=A0ABP7VWC1_9ACTN
MPIVDGLDPEGSIWHYIAITLREQREQRNLSGNKLAQRIGCDRSYVSRVENGRIHLSRAYAEKIDALWETRFAWLVKLAEASDGGDWFTGLVEHEERATHHRMWEALIIPGLFQTEAYARAALAAGLAADIESALERRLARQRAVWERPNPPHVSAIIYWPILEQPVGGLGVMREQLARLLELGDSPNVTVRVLERSVGAHVGMDGSFTLLSFDGRDIAFATAPERGRLIVVPTDVQQFQVRYDRIANLAANRSASRALIEQAMENYR